MPVFSTFTPAVSYLRTMLAARLAAARDGEDRERGASVVEWVVITTIVVVIAVLVGGWIYTALYNKGQQVQGCINVAGGGNTDCGNG
jgi:hypothetical protein